MNITAEQQAVLNEMAEIKAQMKPLEAKLKKLTAKLNIEGEPGQRIPTSVGYLRFDNNRRFDAKTAQENLSEELYRGICTMQPDQKLAKQILTGEEFDSCYAVGAPKKVFVTVEDFDD